MSEKKTLNAVEHLVDIMAILRSPDGCPWDAEQTPESLKPFLVEECYEVLAAIDAGAPEEIRDELGDLLLQVVFLARIFEERGLFDIGDVANAISDKLVRRHPHVFADAGDRDRKSLDLQWDRIKGRERTSRGNSASVMAGIPKELPALLRARKIHEKSNRYHLSPPSGDHRLESNLEAIGNVLTHSEEQVREKAFGDLLFGLVRIGHAMNLDAEDALRMSCTRYVEQLSTLESSLAERGNTIRETPSGELVSRWEKILGRDEKNRG